MFLTSSCCGCNIRYAKVSMFTELKKDFVIFQDHKAFKEFKASKRQSFIFVLEQ